MRGRQRLPPRRRRSRESRFSGSSRSPSANRPLSGRTGPRTTSVAWNITHSMLRICQINYPEAAFHGQAVKSVAYLRVSTPQQDVRFHAERRPGDRQRSHLPGHDGAGHDAVLREKHARRAKRRPGLYPALVVLGIYDRCTPKPAPRHPGGLHIDDFIERATASGQRVGFRVRREAPAAGRADESPPARRPPGRQRTLSARPVAGSGRRRPRRPRQGRCRLRGPEGEHPRRGQARHPDQGHDHPLRAVRRGRARPDLRAHPRGSRQGQGLGPQARAPEGLAGRLTARRQGE